MCFAIVVFFAVNLLSDSQTDFASLSFNEIRNLWRNFTEINIAATCKYKFA